MTLLGAGWHLASAATVPVNVVDDMRLGRFRVDVIVRVKCASLAA